MVLKCSTCGVNLVGQEDFVKFKCPSCGKNEIIRCKRCKALSVGYRCECNFEGP